MGRTFQWLFLMIFVSFFIVLAYLTKDKVYIILGAIILTALANLALLIISLDDSWQGVVMDIKTKTELNTDIDGNPATYQQTLAYIKLDDGSEKIYPAAPTWKVGDRLVKLKGEVSAHIQKA